MIMKVEKGQGYRITHKSKARNSCRPIDWMVCVGGLKEGKHSILPKGPINVEKSQALFLTKQDARAAALSSPEIQKYLKTYSGKETSLYYLDIVPIRKDYVVIQVDTKDVDVPVYVNIDYISRRLRKNLKVNVKLAKETKE